MIDASPAAVLAVWDRAAGMPPAGRRRVLTAFAAPGVAPADLDGWPLGRRDAALAELFRTLYGDAVDATVRCSTCGELLEFTTTIGALFGPSDVAEPRAGAFEFRCGDVELTVRPLAVRDLDDLPPSPAHAREIVLRRCVLAARRAGGDVDVAQLSSAVHDALSEALRLADPMGDIVVRLTCAACETSDAIAFDIGTFVWEALDRSAVQLLVDVHALAGAYGWSEQAILALPETRRRRYLALTDR